MIFIYLREPRNPQGMPAFLVNGSPKHIRLPTNNNIRKYIIIKLFWQEIFLITNAQGNVIFTVIFILNHLCHVNVQMSFGITCF